MFEKGETNWDETIFSFSKLPDFLNYGQYEHLSNSARFAYAAYLKRRRYSKNNNWVDRDKNVYFIYPDRNLARDIHVKSLTTINRIKNELISVGLLFVKRVGFNPKKKRNEPDRLYLLKPRNVVRGFTKKSIYQPGNTKNDNRVQQAQSQSSKQ